MASVLGASARVARLGARARAQRLEQGQPPTRTHTHKTGAGASTG